jgi:hypothetical protein
MGKGKQKKKGPAKPGRPTKDSKGGQPAQKAKRAAAATKAKAAAFAKKQEEMHRSTYTETSKRWSSALKIKSGEMIDFMTRRILMVMILNTVSAMMGTLSFGNSALQLGVAGMTTVFNKVHEATGVSVTFLTSLFKTATEEPDQIRLEQPTVGERGAGSPNVNRDKLRKLSPFHYKAISDYVEWCNDYSGQVIAT